MFKETFKHLKPPKDPKFYCYGEKDLGSNPELLESRIRIHRSLKIPIHGSTMRLRR
jgi:hypothetical protein